MSLRNSKFIRCDTGDDAVIVTCGHKAGVGQTVMLLITSFTSQTCEVVPRHVKY